MASTLDVNVALTKMCRYLQRIMIIIVILDRIVDMIILIKLNRQTSDDSHP